MIWKTGIKDQDIEQMMIYHISHNDIDQALELYKAYTNRPIQSHKPISKIMVWVNILTSFLRKSDFENAKKYMDELISIPSADYHKESRIDDMFKMMFLFVIRYAAHLNQTIFSEELKPYLTFFKDNKHSFSFIDNFLTAYQWCETALDFSVDLNNELLYYKDHIQPHLDTIRKIDIFSVYLRCLIKAEKIFTHLGKETETTFCQQLIKEYMSQPHEG